MQTLHILKSAATLIASSGVGAIVGNAIKASTPGDVTKLQKVTITVGSIALSGMIANQASKYTGEQIEEIATQLKALKTLRNQNND